MSDKPILEKHTDDDSLSYIHALSLGDLFRRTEPGTRPPGGDVLPQPRDLQALKSGVR